MKKVIWLLLALFIIFVGIKTTSAHPHVFIDGHLSAKMSQDGLVGFQLKWIFDDMMSSGVILDYDIDGDGVFNKKERQTVKSEVFDYLKNYNYFTEIEIDGKPFKIKHIQQFKPQILEGKLVYDFFIPCQVMVSSYKKVVKISVYDKEYFSHINMTEENIKISNMKTVGVNFTVYKNSKKSYYFGNLIPIEAKLELLAQ